ncbi:MAG: P-loop containing nucleoside triphosphate hydrolase protein [Monoraphidium minutum]|nr:MAG: P-loop containing nucleoside triphosphate hydrolase protein [Monoraphidium minutum]
MAAKAPPPRPPGPMRPTYEGAAGQTAIIPLWVPVVVVAHLFAAFWLFKTWMLNTPMGKKTRAATRVPSRTKGGSLKDMAAPAGAAGRGDVAVGSDQVAIEVPPPTDVSPFTQGGGPVEEDGELTEAASDLEVFKSLEKPATLTHTFSINVVSSRIEWQDIGCSYNTPQGTKDVLKDIWGIAQPGEMQARRALMGPSGAGKSTFMDILALRKSVGTLTGRILVNGHRATKAFIRKTAYVPQEDNFVPTMTAWEVMKFYADIILPGRWTSTRRRERIREVLAEVGLAHAHSTIVGGTLPGGLMMRGLSGGERRRLAIATGILAAPSVLFLDEPTSGLDSFAALTVMGYLKRMAREQSHVVIASIHQPRAAIWQMFDAVTLLASGRLMYHGPREGITPWFGSLGYNYDSDLHGVPSDWALDLVAIGFAKPARFYGHTITNKDELLSAASSFKGHYLQQQGLKGDEGTAADDGSKASGAAPDKTPQFATGAFKQYKTLLGRELLSITRNPFDVAGRTLTFVWVGILMGILYYGLPFDARSVRSRLNLVYMLLAFYCLMPYISAGLYTADKKFYLSDASSQLYRPASYYLAKARISAITPFQIVSALAFGFTAYGMAGLRPGYQHILKNGVINTLMSLIASQVLHACAVFAPNQDVAFMMSILWTAIQLLLSGFFVNFPEVINQWLTYLRYVSATYYSFEAVTQIEFAGVNLSCRQGFSQTEMAFVLGAFPNTSNSQKNQVNLFLGQPNPNCVMDTNSIIRYFQFGRPFWMSVVILLGYLGVCHLLTFGAMLVAARRERR